MVKVMEFAKIIVDEVSIASGELNTANEKPVSATPTNITTAQPSEATKITVDITTAPKAKGIVFYDKEDSTTRTASSKSEVKDKGKAKLVEEPEILKLRKAQIAIDEEDNAEKQKLEEQKEAEELKKNLEIVPDDEDDVFMNVTPLSSKLPTIVDYKIYKEGKKEHFQIIRANEDNVWKHQKGLQGLANAKNWKLFDSCGVYCVNLDTIQLFLLAERMYQLTNYTLQQIFNEVRLQVDYEVEMAYDLLSLVRKQLREGYVS
nr:hypothetical protein [Tanacetum cinerariifolium]